MQVGNPVKDKGESDIEGKFTGLFTVSSLCLPRRVSEIMNMNQC